MKKLNERELLVATTSETHYFIIKTNILIGFAAILLITGACTCSAATITVDEAGSADYQSIQDAVNASNPEDTILVSPGTYNENVDVDRPLIISSTNGAAVTKVISAPNYNNVFEVTADCVTITGFTVVGSMMSNFEIENTGIYLNSNNNKLTDNILEDHYCGISLINSDNNELAGNMVLGEGEYGIHINLSSNNTVDNNTISFTETYISHGIFIANSNSNILSNNSVSGGRHSGIGMHDSCYNILTCNSISNTDEGPSIRIMSSKYNILKNNMVNGHSGILVDGRNNMLINNVIDYYTGYGISLNPNSNVLINNTIIDYMAYNDDEEVHIDQSSSGSNKTSAAWELPFMLLAP